MKARFGLLFCLLFLVLRIAGDPLLQQMPIWVSVLFECLFLSLAFVLLKPRVDRFLLKPDVQDRKALYRITAILVLMGIVFGALMILGSGVLSITLPWNFKDGFFSSGFLVIQFFLFGPLIEELLFRWAIWDLLATRIKSVQWISFLTALLFSVNHLTSAISASSEFLNFIYFQSIYTFLLGLLLAWVQIRAKAWIPSFILHLSFNFGFYLGSLIL